MAMWDFLYHFASVFRCSSVVVIVVHISHFYRFFWNQSILIFVVMMILTSSKRISQFVLTQHITWPSWAILDSDFKSHNSTKISTLIVVFFCFQSTKQRRCIWRATPTDFLNEYKCYWWGLLQRFLVSSWSDINLTAMGNFCFCLAETLEMFSETTHLKFVVT